MNVLVQNVKRILSFCGKSEGKLNRFSTTFSNKEQQQTTKIMKVFNVAEKNDVAKNVSGILSRGTHTNRPGKSPYNRIYEFRCQVFDQDCQMVFTSVSGHLLNYDFTRDHSSWHSCSPVELFDAPVVKQCPVEKQKDRRQKNAPPNAKLIRQNLEFEVRFCDALIIWTDCDREGENIGYEVIDVCRKIKPNIRVYRAKFSEITSQAIYRAINNLGEPNKAVSDAVDVRSELDLRIGAAFTRFQTMRLQKAFPVLAKHIISYGSCQFPTLGFVVERWLARENFIPEPYWKLVVLHTIQDLTVEFRWARVRLFEELPCQIYLEECLDNPTAKVEKKVEKAKSKWRPLPLDTVELEKQGSRKLRMTAKSTMQTAEKLYTKGFISYPRTETNIFPEGLNLARLVQDQTAHPEWGDFAQRVMNEGGPNPRRGKKSDQAHPPIHPTKLATDLNGDEKKVYEFVVRHFLACVHKDAQGTETIVDIDVAGEKFTATGLFITARNYLDVYFWEKWNAKEIHEYTQGQTFQPTEIKMLQEMTNPPQLLTEADLIALMDKHGIGTDATHAEHIETIKSREYVGLAPDRIHFLPGKLGIGLVTGYDEICAEMSKPYLRAELERGLVQICENAKPSQEVLREQIAKYRHVFQIAVDKATAIDRALARWLERQPEAVPDNVDIARPDPVMKCPKCRNTMSLRTSQRGVKFIGCSGFPECNNAIWLRLDGIEGIEVLQQTCQRCPGEIKRLKLTIATSRLRDWLMPDPECEICIGCCNDDVLLGRLNIKRENVLPSNNANNRNNNANNNQRPNQAPNAQQQNNPRPTPANAQGNNNRPQNAQRNNPPPNVPPPNNPRNPGFNNGWNNQRGAWGNANGGNLGNAQSSRNNPGPSNSRFNNNQNNAGASNDTYVCQCNQPAKQLTVRKDNHNQGRMFYTCATGGCGFFLWADDRPGDNGGNGGGGYNPGPPPPGPPRPPGPSNFGNNAGGINRDDNGTVLCRCNEPASRSQSQKNNANKGKYFYGCAHFPRVCTFFAWDDDQQDQQNQQQNNWGGLPGPSQGGWQGASGRSRGGRGSRGSRRTSRGGGSRSRGGSTRKCGNCSMPGHTRNNCPNGGAMDFDD